jgi:hypothetical protein
VIQKNSEETKRSQQLEVPVMTLFTMLPTLAPLGQRLARKVIPMVLIGVVLILSLFAGAIISSIFLHAVEF